jgi:hypothetical protein
MAGKGKICLVVMYIGMYMLALLYNLSFMKFSTRCFRVNYKNPFKVVMRVLALLLIFFKK